MYLELDSFEKITISREESRVLFLEAVDEVEPEVLRKLRDHVFPYYDSDSVLTWEECSQNDLYAQLKDSMLTWAQEYRLTYPWVYQTALRTLWVWFVADPSDTEGVDLVWHHDIDAGMILDSKNNTVLTFIHDHFDPNKDTKKSYKKKTLAAFEKYLDRYLRRKEHLLTKKSQPANGTFRPEEFFQWYAQHLVNELSAQDIASLYSDNNKKIDARLVKLALDQIEKRLESSVP